MFEPPNQPMFSIFTFKELGADLLYAILRLRQQVFVIEQQSIYDDLDNLDQDAQHLCIFSKDKNHSLLGYARLRAVENGKIGKIERVVTSPEARRQGIGSQLMEGLLERCKVQHFTTVELAAQVDVLDFYHQWGFSVQGEPFDDGGILHQKMTLSLQ